MNEQFFWYAARSTGIVAWALAAAAVIWGLLLSTRSARGLAKPVWVLDLHRYLGVLTLVVTASHLGALVADSRCRRCSRSGSPTAPGRASTC
jgi:hypothetical protein